MDLEPYKANNVYKIPILVGVWKGHSGLSWIFNGVLFVAVSYRKSCGFFYGSTLSQLFPFFTPYSCQWRDCTLGELLISLGKIIMTMIFCSDLYSLYFTFIILLGQIPKIIHVKMLNNEEIVSFPHYLVVNHCNADDLELGEHLIDNL